MDEREWMAEQAEGAALPDGAEEAAEGALEESADVNAAKEVAAKPGERPTHNGAVAEAEEPAQSGAVAEAEESTQSGAIVGTEEPTQAGAAAEAGEHTGVCASAGGVESAEAAGGIVGSEAEWRRRAEGYALQVVFSEARAAAATLGVPECRLDHVARLSDLSGIGPEDDGARERIARAVRAVLKELPELRGGVGTGQATTPRRPRRDAFERGFLGD